MAIGNESEHPGNEHPGNGSASESSHALFERLIKILGMTTSANDPTALIAIRRANECLERLNTDWRGLLTGKVTIIQDPFVNVPPPPPPKAAPPRDEPPRKPRAGSPAQPKPQPRPQPAQPRWKPRFTDVTQIQACLDKVLKNPIKHQGTAYRIRQIEREFRVQGSLEQADWSFLAGTAASLRGATVTADML
jgi:hypothetical protein